MIDSYEEYKDIEYSPSKSKILDGEYSSRKINSPDKAHPFADAMVPVYPFARFVRRDIDDFFKAFGIEPDEAEREWEDWKGFDPALVPKQDIN